MAEEAKSTAVAPALPQPVASVARYVAAVGIDLPDGDRLEEGDCIDQDDPRIASWLVEQALLQVAPPSEGDL